MGFFCKRAKFTQMKKPKFSAILIQYFINLLCEIFRSSSYKSYFNHYTWDWETCLKEKYLLPGWTNMVPVKYLLAGAHIQSEA